MKVIQVFFHESQYEKLEGSFYPYYNKECDVFFENSVIRKLVGEGEHVGHEYFGVVSHKLREKIGFTKENWKNNPNIANISTNNFSVEQFAELLYFGLPDAMSFQRHVPHDTISVADQFHPGFKNFWSIIMHKIGVKWEPVRYQDVFYCNFFVAKSEWYERYVKEMLAPAMDVMAAIPELYDNSRYPQPLPPDLREKWGFDFYTFHPFLCERMFTHFVHMHNLKCLHY